MQMDVGTVLRVAGATIGIVERCIVTWLTGSVCRTGAGTHDGCVSRNEEVAT